MRSVKRQKMCSLANLKKALVSNTLYEPVAVSFCHPEPDFLPRCAGHGCVCAFPCKERRMKFANATNLNRKSGGAKPRDLRFCGWKRGIRWSDRILISPAPVLMNQRVGCGRARPPKPKRA